MLSKHNSWFQSLLVPPTWGLPFLSPPSWGVAICAISLIVGPLWHEYAAADFQIIKDQRYGNAGDTSGLCDVYLPADQTRQPFPVVLVVHGGGWVSGDKWTIAGYARELADSGFAAIAINYRLAPQHKFPKQVDDVRQAMIWTRENAGRFSLDVDRLGLFGYSAGGHLVALIASLADEPIATQASASDWTAQDTRWTKLPDISAVCAGGPPCDFRTIPANNTTLAYFLGGSRSAKPEVYDAASPLTHVSAGDPVTQIIHGENDIIVPITSSRTFHQAQKQRGVDSRMKTLPKQGHMVTFMNPETSETMVDFFRQVLVDRP
tara:strand:- start:75255 stop:76214 length:960 start_codon:yes stop_codon:yes gene_type:complete